MYNSMYKYSATQGLWLHWFSHHYLGFKKKLQKTTPTLVHSTTAKVLAYPLIGFQALAVCLSKKSYRLAMPAIGCQRSDAKLVTKVEGFFCWICDVSRCRIETMVLWYVQSGGFLLPMPSNHVVTTRTDTGH